MVEATFLYRLVITMFVSHFTGYFKTQNAVIHMVNIHGLFCVLKKYAWFQKKRETFFFLHSLSPTETEKGKRNYASFFEGADKFGISLMGKFCKTVLTKSDFCFGFPVKPSRKVKNYWHCFCMKHFT